MIEYFSVMNGRFPRSFNIMKIVSVTIDNTTINVIIGTVKISSRSNVSEPVATPKSDSTAASIPICKAFLIFKTKNVTIARLSGKSTQIA